MKIFKTFVIVSCICFVFCGNSVFSQSGKKSKGKPVSTLTNEKRTDEKVEPGDYFPKNEIKSPFRYIIVDSDLRFDDEEEKVPVSHSVTVLMEEGAFYKSNLIYLFNYLANYFAEPTYLAIVVHTSLNTLETIEEQVALSTHSSRDKFRKYHKTATYVRSGDILNCSAGFIYDSGKSGKFAVKHVNLNCATKVTRGTGPE